jgi:hypothetical protein
MVLVWGWGPVSKGTLIPWLTRRPEKAEKPERGMERIGIGDLVSAKVSEKNFMILGEVGRFLVLGVSEPYLSVGSDAKPILFPRDFTDVKKFFTGDKPLSVNLRFYYCPSNDGRYVSMLLEHLMERAGKYGFVINLYHSKNCGDLYNAVIDAMNTQGVIVGAAVPVADKDKFLLVKAHSLIRNTPSHLINLERLRKIIEEDCKGVKPSKCPAYLAYALNNIVQLYAKAGGIPWVPEDPSLLQNVAVIGIATAKLRDDSGYAVGVAYAIAYFGRKVESFVSADLFNLKDLDAEVIRAKGLYIPGDTASKLLHRIVNACAKSGIKGYVIFQTPVIHKEEVEALQNTFANSPWVLVHVKRGGFAKRIYDKATNDGGPLRGVCILHKDYAETFAGSGLIKSILTVTGYTEDGDKLYKGTPRPLEMEILIQQEQAGNVDPIRLAVYISRLTLLLGKMDWEAYSNWPKIPFVVKYAHRIAEMLARTSDELRKRVLEALQNRGAELRYIM